MNPQTLEDGYAALAAAEARWLAEGRRPVGWKVGLSSKAAQQRFEVSGPCFGRLFADMEIENGGTVAAGRFPRARIEAEIAFRIGASGASQVLPAIEILHSRIPGGPARVGELIADNLSGAGFVLGAPVLFERSFDFKGCSATVSRSGSPACVGVGRAVLGNPLYALEWLTKELAQRGRVLAVGETVLSGSLITPLDVREGDEIEARLDGLGAVSVRFARDA